MKLTMTILAGALFAAGCGNGNGNDNREAASTGTPTPAPTATPATVTAQAVVENYAELLYANYDAALTGAEALHDAVDALIATPSQATLDAARAAWIASRPAYQQSEYGRFYNGPIDAPPTNYEALINSWPLDENFIDYVEGAPTSGIINDPVGFPTIDKATLAALNQASGETNVSTGYHAIEFLLWGQDHSATGPGDRPFTDYATDGTGTAANQTRRGQYLEAVSQLLIDDLTAVRVQWAPNDSTNYRAAFVALDPKEALGRMLTGLGSLSSGELGGERLSVAFETRDQEDEHSCFSDNTRDDLANDGLGIQNAYLGRYGNLEGPGIDALVQQADPTLAATMEGELTASVAALRAIPQPFDQAILGADDSPGRVVIHTAITDVFAQGHGFASVAAALGVSIGTGD